MCQEPRQPSEKRHCKTFIRGSQGCELPRILKGTRPLLGELTMRFKQACRHGKGCSFISRGGIRVWILLGHPARRHSYVHTFLGTRAHRLACAVCTQRGGYVVSLDKNCTQRERGKKQTHNQTKVGRGRDEIAVDYGSGSRCSTRIQLAAASLFPWQRNQ